MGNVISSYGSAIYIIHTAHSKGLGGFMRAGKFEQNYFLLVAPVISTERRYMNFAMQ